MNMLGYHVRWRLTESRSIVKSLEERRIVARVMLDHGRRAGLLSCDVPDDHGHATVACDRARAGQFAHSVEASLKQLLCLPVGFAQYEPKPIVDGRHLYHAVRYSLRQPERHGVDADPFREASNLPDLLGLRLLGSYTVSNLRSRLPRLRRDELLEWLGVPTLEAMDDPVEQIWEAARRATALGTLRGSSPLAVSARRAAVVVVGRRLGTAEIAQRLFASERSVRWLRSTPADPALVRAIRLQLGLAAVLGERCDLSRAF